jgi:hypothetical protein
MADSLNIQPHPRDDFKIDRYFVEEITPARLQRVLEIIEASFPRWPPFEINVSSLDHLRWKLEYPGWAPNRIRTIILDGIEAYVSLTIHRIFSFNGRVYRARDWVDSCVHPDFQKKGLFNYAYEATLEKEHEYDFGIWSAINPYVLAAMNKFTPQHIDLGPGLNALVKAIAPSHELAKRYFTGSRFGLKRRILSKAISVARIFGGLPWLRAPVNDRLEIRRIEDIDEVLSRFESLLKRIHRPAGLFQERSRDYVRWRYCDPRGGRSIIIFAFENGRPVGGVVCKMSDNIGFVIDLITHPARQDAASELIGAADDLLRREGASAIVCRLPDDAPLRKTLLAHRYFPAPLQTGCFLRPGVLSAGELRNLLKSRSHHLMMGDFDWV